jgi:heme oxygenase
MIIFRSTRPCDGAPLTASLPERLRLETRALHVQTERSGAMADLLAGRLDRGGFTALLRNLHAIYLALEQALEHHAAARWLAPLPWRALQRAPALAEDLVVLHGPGWRDDLPLQPASAGYVERLEGLDAADPPTLVAHAYVRYLGDLHGGQMLRRVIARQLDLKGEAGTRFYDFGDEPRVLALRQALRTGLAALPLDDAAADRVVAEAQWAFMQHQQLFVQLRAADPASV